MIEQDPKRPGPNYYDDCKHFNWVDALVEKHKESLTGDGKSMYDIKFNKEDEQAWQLLQERLSASYLKYTYLATALSIAYISVF